MSDSPSPETPRGDDAPATPPEPEKQFHLWRLLAALLGVILGTMVVAAIVNVVVLGW